MPPSSPVPSAPRSGTVAPGAGPLATYQGSKFRFAPAIVDEMEAAFGPAAWWPAFVDVCAGTASVTLEVLRRAPALAPRAIAVDAGLWGAFWEAFHADRAGVRAQVAALLADGGGRAAACRRLVGTPMNKDAAKWAGEFLIIQGAMRHGRALPPEAEGGLWNPVNPNACVTPALRRASADGLLARLDAVPAFKAVRGDAAGAKFPENAVVYIDPPYLGTIGYRGLHCDVVAVLRAATKARGKAALSHHVPYPGVTGPQKVVTTERCLRRVCHRELLIVPAVAA